MAQTLTIDRNLIKDHTRVCSRHFPDGDVKKILVFIWGSDLHPRSKPSYQEQNGPRPGNQPGWMWRVPARKQQVAVL